MLQNSTILRNSAPIFRASKLRTREIILNLIKKAARKAIRPTMMPANISKKVFETINNSDEAQFANWRLRAGRMLIYLIKSHQFPRKCHVEHSL